MNENKNKTIFLDIEATGLNASTDIVVCIGIFDPKKFKEPILFFVNRPEEETKALLWLKDQIVKNKYKIICGWNSKGYDIPFLVGRSIKLGLDFSEIIKLQQLDLLDVARATFKSHSYKMEDVCKWLDIQYDSGIHGFIIDQLFHQHLSGDKNAEEKIKARCKNDLEALKKIFEKLEPYIRELEYY